MNRLQKFITLTALAVTMQVSTTDAMEIKQINSLKEISTVNFKPGTVVLIDLDETVVIDPKHTPKPYQHLIKPGQKYRLIETDIAKTMSTLKTCVNNDGKNVTILGLTKRGMKRNGQFDHGHQHIADEKIPVATYKFKNFNGSKLCNNPNACFYNGIIYTDGKNKGDYLKDFLKCTGFQPTHVVMADDKAKNLQEVGQFVATLNIPYEGYQMNGVALLK